MCLTTEHTNEAKTIEQRYAVILNSVKIGTISLDPELRGTIVARMAPLPAFRKVARLQRAVSAARQREEYGSETDPSIWDAAVEEGAEAVLGSLRFSLADDRTGQAVATSAIELQYDQEPPRLSVTW